jgi:hypothetical protein
VGQKSYVRHFELDRGLYSEIKQELAETAVDKAY